jgi:hypothetical protein
MKRTRFDFVPRRQSRMFAAEALTVETSPTPALVLRRQDPPMSDVDEVLMLLQTAAEIEHSLLAEYLYAAYSLNPETYPQWSWRETLVGIAREEMGHLLGVQNLLLALGGPLSFERDDQPFSDFYPFPFSLDPFSVKTAAEYVLVEMPDIKQIPPDLGFDFEQVKQDAGIAHSDEVINRVGLLYELLSRLVQELDESYFHQDSLNWQATPQEWAASVLNLTIRTVGSREDATALLGDIARQGEGITEPPGGTPSHFRRFFELYQEMRASGTAPLSENVPTNPDTRNEEASGYISDNNARLWAHLFNLRYRILLAQLDHHLRLRIDLQPERGTRIRLRSWCIEEMKTYLTGTSAQLTQLPQHDPPQFSGGRLDLAGPPFELPYTLNLPSREVDRWRYHEMLVRQSFALIDELHASLSQQPFLTQLRAWDEQRLVFIRQQIVTSA